MAALRWPDRDSRAKTTLTTISRASQKEKVAHKRQISEAIPGNERDNGGLSRPEAAPARTQESTQEGTQAAGQEARSGGRPGGRSQVRPRTQAQIT